MVLWRNSSKLVAIYFSSVASSLVSPQRLLHFCQFGLKKLQAVRSPTIHLPHGIKKEYVLHYQIKDSCEYKKASVKEDFSSYSLILI